MKRTNKFPVRLVINTQPFYGSIETVSEHATFIEAIKAGLAYRKANPGCNMLEVYDHTPGDFGHSLESTFYWSKIVEAAEAKAVNN